jgi:carbamoyl-phosphate synthase large subunit
MTLSDTAYQLMRDTAISMMRDLGNLPVAVMCSLPLTPKPKKLLPLKLIPV